MICLDANYFLRALVQPHGPEESTRHRQAKHLFMSAAEGREEVTATTVAIHETLFILTAKLDKNGYGMSPAESCARMRQLLVVPGFRHPEKDLVLAALDLWSANPSLGFSDSFTATVVRHHGYTLATFDSDFDALANLDRYRPAA
jgi:predicted nucleic acid-binding protein